MRSARFGGHLIVTEHAHARMAERHLDEALVMELIESGEVRQSGPGQLFVFKHFPNRRDNLVCAAVAVRHGIIVVKTVMVNWTLRERS